jgi:hypothetical protein
MFLAFQGFAQELLYIMSGDHVGVPNVNMFVGSAKFLPKGAQPDLSIVSTGGTTPDHTQNSVILPAYQRPGAQIVCRADTGPAAETLARAAYNSLVKTRNEYIGSGIVSATGTWYRKIRPLQEPFDFGIDPGQGRPRYAFNVLGDKRPS